MAKKVSVAEAKREFSEIVSRVSLRGERFIIERRGKPMAVLVSVQDMQALEASTDEKKQKGLLAAVGAWGDFTGLDHLVEEIYDSRRRAKDRPVKKLR
jgi:prevent-host-death family protein